jgi:hypothetical protein
VTGRVGAHSLCPLGTAFPDSLNSPFPKRRFKNIVQCVRVCYSVLQYSIKVIVCHGVLRHAAMCHGMLQCVLVCSNMVWYDNAE